MAERSQAIRIAAVDRTDLPVVAMIHERAWPASAITAFGREAIRRYYAWLLDGPHDAALVGAWIGDRLVGFCAAGMFRGAMSGFLRVNRGYLMLRVATHPRLLGSPLIRQRLKEGMIISFRFSRFRRQRRAGVGRGPARRFSVLAIATDPSVRGAGAGRALMLDAEQRARGSGHDRMMLTVHVDNHRAVRFYEQLGWQRVNAQVGAWSGAMIKTL